MYVLVDCVWGEWKYGECSALCGGGVLTYNRTKIVVEENGGTCEGAANKEEECNTNPCIGM